MKSAAPMRCLGKGTADVRGENRGGGAMTSDQAGDVRADPPVPEDQGREVPAQREAIASSGMSPKSS